MSAYRKILVAVDGSPAAGRGLREAIRLAREERAQLVIVHVVNEFYAYYSVEGAGLVFVGPTPEQIREGAEATLKQLKSALERNKVVAIDPAVGAKFDPAQHQAISMVPADQEANTVVSVLQKGYLIAERVLRPALVTVAAPK